MTAVVEPEELEQVLQPSDRRLGVWYIVGGLIGLLASFIITVEKFHLLADPNYVPSCSISPIISCGSVMESWQSGVFGFPNPLIGLIAFTVMTTLGVLVVAHLTLPRWIWTGFNLGIAAGLAFVAWLAYNTLFDIGALCPYCIVVWSVVIPTFWLTTARTYRVARNTAAAVDAAAYVVLPIFFSYLILVVLIGYRFWYYWSSLVG